MNGRAAIRLIPLKALIDKCAHANAAFQWNSRGRVRGVRRRGKLVTCAGGKRRMGEATAGDGGRRRATSGGEASRKVRRACDPTNQTNRPDESRKRARRALFLSHGALICIEMGAHGARLFSGNAGGGIGFFDGGPPRDRSSFFRSAESKRVFTINRVDAGEFWRRGSRLEPVQRRDNLVRVVPKGWRGERSQNTNFVIRSHETSTCSSREDGNRPPNPPLRLPLPRRRSPRSNC